MPKPVSQPEECRPASHRCARRPGAGRRIGNAPRRPVPDRRSTRAQSHLPQASRQRWGSAVCPPRSDNRPDARGGTMRSLWPHRSCRCEAGKQQAAVRRDTCGGCQMTRGRRCHAGRTTVVITYPKRLGSIRFFLLYSRTNWLGLKRPASLPEATGIRRNTSVMI